MRLLSVEEFSNSTCRFRFIDIIKSWSEREWGRGNTCFPISKTPGLREIRKVVQVSPADGKEVVQDSRTSKWLLNISIWIMTWAFLPEEIIFPVLQAIAFI